MATLQSATRQALADEMTRKSLMRRLDQIEQSGGGGNFGGIVTGPVGPLNQALAGRVTSSGSSNPGAAQKARWDRDFEYEFNQGPTAYHGGPLSPTEPAGPGRDAVNVAAREDALDAIDRNNAAMRAGTERSMEDAYGGSGAYGHGITQPGGKAPAAATTAPDPKAAKVMAALESKYKEAELVAKNTDPSNLVAVDQAKARLVKAGAALEVAKSSAPAPAAAAPTQQQGQIIGTPDMPLATNNPAAVAGWTALMSKYGAQPTESVSQTSPATQVAPDWQSQVNPVNLGALGPAPAPVIPVIPGGQAAAPVDANGQPIMAAAQPQRETFDQALARYKASGSSKPAPKK